MSQAPDPYEIYLAVREAVLRMKGVEASAGAAPSAYWAEELSNIDYLMEASPLIIRKLRHHAFQITGIRPYDYRVQDDSRRHAFERRLRSLVDLGGSDLLVPEHDALGGFGYALPEGMFNLDTIKFFEVLVGMRRAGVLSVLDGERPVVLEVGGGWGGFAYQVKSLFPRVSYVIVDFPELFLFSATYLQTVFPDARIAFGGAGEDVSSWRGADFVFLPSTEAERVREMSPALTVNIASFQEMTSDQVEAYAKLASDAGCPVLYSLNRERSRYNSQLSSVSELVGRYYELRDVPLLDTDYTKATKKPPKAAGGAPTQKDRGGDEDFVYRHLVGTRRGASVAAAAAPAAERQPAGSPRVGIGATLFNRAPFMREALDSLLTQTYRDFCLVLVDDGSSDGTEAIALEYASRDPRVRYVRHAERQGMTASWRHAFEEATAAGARYFAWASDHDRWDTRWLETLVEVMDREPDAVLAYPYTRRIDADGRLLEKPPRLFDTEGADTLEERWSRVCGEHLACGDMVYGLMRADAVRRAGVFRDVVSPDRLLMAELALLGPFRQVPQELWYRRQFDGGSSVARQRTSLFAGRVPRGRWLPPWLQHGLVLWRVYVAPVSATAGRRAARRRVLQYTMAYLLKHQQKSTTYRQFGAVLRGFRWLRKRVKHYVLLGVFHALVSTRRAYHRTVYEVAVFTRRIGLR